MPGSSNLAAVKNIRIEVSSGRPRQRPSDGIDACGTEHFVSVDLGRDPPQRALEVEFSHQAVGEDQSQHATAEVLDACDSCRTTHGSILLEGLDRRQGSRFLGQPPVLQQFVVMK
jgi:hypothetical protein